MHLIRQYFKSGVSKILRIYFIQRVRAANFCIISNDCWGGEVYKLLNREFNTPFIGLFLMGPCYVQLLGNIRENICKRLVFIDGEKSKYFNVLINTPKYPIAVLEGTSIEIHFLHYSNPADAELKWNRRLNRMDWENIFVKYDCSKDFSNANTISAFDKLSFERKLIFGNESARGHNVIQCKEYSTDAVKQFRNCFLAFDPIGWLIGKERFDFFSRNICFLAYKYLRL